MKQREYVYESADGQREISTRKARSIRVGGVRYAFAYEAYSPEVERGAPAMSMGEFGPRWAKLEGVTHYSEPLRGHTAIKWHRWSKDGFPVTASTQERREYQQASAEIGRQIEWTR